jgi:outer membrane protein W
MLILLGIIDNGLTFFNRELKGGIEKYHLHPLFLIWEYYVCDKFGHLQPYVSIKLINKTE